MGNQEAADASHGKTKKEMAESARSSADVGFHEGRIAFPGMS
jgi:hypothetical protein